jgi:hypothetical protein
MKKRIATDEHRYTQIKKFFFVLKNKEKRWLGDP